MKKLVAILLTAVMLLGCLSGCGDNTDPTTNNPNGSASSSSAAQTKYAYQASYMPLDIEGFEIRYISGMTAAGDQVVLLANCITGRETIINEATGEPYTDDNGEPLMQDTYESRLFTLNPETGTMQQLDYSPRKPEEGKYGYSYASGLTSMADGSFWFYDEVSTYYYDLPEDFDSESDNVYQYYIDDGTSVMCYHYDSQGSLRNTVTLETTQDQYLGDVRFTEQGIYATDYSTIYRYDETGKVTQSLPLDGGMDGMLVLKNGLAISLWGESGYCVKPVDESTMTLGENIALPANVYNVMAGFGDYDYLYQNNGIFFGLKDGVSEQVLSWIDCDVDAANLDNYQFQEDGTVYAIESQYENEKTNYNLIVLHQVDAATLPERQILTLACLNLPWDLRTEIIQFNKSQSDVRITVTDYSQYATEDGNAAAIQKLNTEILSGVVPDLLYITDGEIPADIYAAKGILQDIWPLIDADPELNRDDLMTHFFDVLSVDGKLYQVTDSFRIETVVGRSDVIGTDTSWTMEQMMEAFGTLEDGASLFGEMDTRENMFNTIIGQNINQFVDWTTGQCSFETQNFMDLLNLVKQFPETFDYDNYDWSNYGSEGVRMRMRKQLVYQASLWGFSDLQHYNTMCEGKANYIGYPTTDGSGSRFAYSGGLAISTACQNTDAAWQFVRQFLTEEHQTSEYMYQFPTNRHSFETYAKDCMTVKLEKDNMDYMLELGIAMTETATAETEDSAETETEVEGDQEMIRGTYYFSQGEYVNWYHMTQEEYDQFMALYEAVDTVGFDNESISDIIWQECEVFFAGQKTAQETASLVQNRVSLYVAEQS